MNDPNEQQARPRVHLLWTTDLPAQRNRAVYQRTRWLAEHCELHLHTSSTARIAPELADLAHVHRIPLARLQRMTLIGSTLWQLFAGLWLLLRIGLAPRLNLYAFHRHGSGSAGLIKLLRGHRVCAVVDMQHTPHYYVDFAEAPGLTDNVRRGYRWVGRLERAWARVWLPRMDLVCALAFDADEGIARIMREDFAVAPEHLLAIPNGVDMVQADALRSRRRASRDGPHLIFAGNLRVDRLDMLGRMLAAFQQLEPATRMWLCGTGGHAAREHLRRMKVKGLDYLGVLEHDALMQRYRDADVALVLIDTGMRDHLHALPGKLFEAMAMGLVVVATDFPAARRLIDPGRSGFILGDGDFDAVAERVLAVLQDGERRWAMRSAAVEQARTLDWAQLNTRWWTRVGEVLRA